MDTRLRVVRPTQRKAFLFRNATNQIYFVV